MYLSALICEISGYFRELGLSICGTLNFTAAKIEFWTAVQALHFPSMVLR